MVPVILCGGEGARLWPVSRKERPKPFMPMADGRTLLRHAIDRGARIGQGRMAIVTALALKFQVAGEYRLSRANGPGLTLMLEPVARNTAAAIATAALEVETMAGPEAVMVVLPADHLIADEVEFARRVAEAADLAAAGRIVVFGIRPDAPSTEYGYVEIGAGGAVRFTEKPDAATAEKFRATGRHFWNSGIFAMSARAALAAFAQHAPKLLEAARKAHQRAARATDGDIEEVTLDAEAYGRAEDISFDYAVMEKAGNISAIPCDIGWSDLGSWPAMGALVAADADGNRIEGEAILIGSHNAYVRSDDRMVGVVGLDNLIVVDTADALLVAAAGRAAEVRELYGELKAKGHEVALSHRTAFRPWGTYTVLLEGPGFKIKRIVVNPGGRLSLQLHHRRSEHWVVVSGRARITHGETVREIGVNQSAYIEVGAKHRLENPGEAPLVVIEVQCGNYLGEDDIERFDDVYGRGK
ncbi:MAG: mannose-1-phosphate guanylyltransferase/mannose-6-phosphate isomerase [Cucumibacter sp.]